MSNADDLLERARMFERRAVLAKDLVLRQHYRKMASHYRALAVEHLESKPRPRAHLIVSGSENLSSDA